ncbi:MAG: signal peptidase II [Saccharofermentanales bacterium]|jgi:signal peptidase II
MAVVTILILVVLDQYSKALAEYYLAEGAVKIIPGFFELELTWNSGAAWNFLAAKSWGIVLLSISSLLVSAVVLFYLGKAHGLKAQIVLVLIAAGGIGNLIDRIRFGRVTDFLSFIFGSYKFPVFNLADTFVTIGVILAIIFLLLDHSFIEQITGNITSEIGDAK